MIRRLFFHRVQLFATPWTAACQSSLSFTVSQSLLKIMFIESMMPSRHLLLCHSLLLLPSIFSSHRVISDESAFHIRRPKYWSFSFSIHPSNNYSGLISSKTDWYDLLAVQQGSSKTEYCLYFYYSWPWECDIYVGKWSPDSEPKKQTGLPSQSQTMLDQHRTPHRDASVRHSSWNNRRMLTPFEQLTLREDEGGPGKHSLFLTSYSLIK